jgi:glycosyltransferase involved in cell wall biosynthesis
LTSPRSGSLQSIDGLQIESAAFSPELTYGAGGGARKLAYLLAIPRIRRLASSYKPDVFHAHYVSSYGVLATLACLRPRAVSIWGADVYRTPYVSRFHWTIIKHVLRTANVVLSTSWTMRNQGLHIFHRDIQVIPFGIEIDRFTSASQESDRNCTTIGTVKSLEKKYGIDVLLEAFAIVRQRSRAAVRLRIAGGGSCRRALEALAARLDIESYVTFLGRVEYSRVHETHRSLDIAVFPSVDDSESFGVSVIEAQASGRPVIVSRVGGLPEVVRDGETALIVDPRDPQRLADAILVLLNDPDLASRMGDAGRKHVRERYDIERCVDLLEQEYRRLAGRDAYAGC